MFHIYYLKLTKIGYAMKPYLHDHFILSFNKNFFVLSSNPINGLKSTFIHTQNIRGQFKPQYVIEKCHIFNAKHHIFEYSAKGMQYLVEHKEKFQAVLEVLQNLPQ
jgi:hypothetical protein